MQEPSFAELKIICLDLNRRLRFLEGHVQELETKLTQHREDKRLHERNVLSPNEPIEARSVSNYPVRYSKEEILSYGPREEPATGKMEN